eukprot:1727177-Rhodomonas_salina.6
MRSVTVNTTRTADSPAAGSHFKVTSIHHHAAFAGQRVTGWRPGGSGKGVCAKASGGRNVGSRERTFGLGREGRGVDGIALAAPPMAIVGKLEVFLRILRQPSCVSHRAVRQLGPPA